MTALQGMAASKIQDFQSLMSECLWQGKEPDEGGGFSFPGQHPELELEPNSHPQSPRRCQHRAGFSSGKEFGVEFYLPSGNLQEKRRFQAVALVGELEFIFFCCCCTKELLEQRLLVRLFGEGSWGGGSTAHPGGWMGSSSLQGCSCEPQGALRAGPGWAVPQRECGSITSISTGNYCRAGQSPACRLVFNADLCCTCRARGRAYSNIFGVIYILVCAKRGQRRGSEG